MGCSATVPCAAGGTCCDGLCQNLQTDPAHCGACAVTACAANFADCDGNAANGCEFDTGASLAHCGACGRACTIRVSGGATITMAASNGTDTALLIDRDAAGSPIVVPGVSPAPMPFDGQVIQMDVVSVTPVP